MPQQKLNVEVLIQLVVLDQQACKYCILDKDLMEFLLSVFLKTVIDAFLKFGYSVFCSTQMHSKEKMFKSTSTTLVLLEYYLQFQFDKHVHSAQPPSPQSQWRVGIHFTFHIFRFKLNGVANLQSILFSCLTLRMFSFFLTANRNKGFLLVRQSVSQSLSIKAIMIIYSGMAWCYEEVIRKKNFFRGRWFSSEILIPLYTPWFSKAG